MVLLKNQIWSKAAQQAHRQTRALSSHVQYRAWHRVIASDHINFAACGQVYDYIKEQVANNAIS